MLDLGPLAGTYRQHAPRVRVRGLLRMLLFVVAVAYLAWLVVAYVAHHDWFTLAFAVWLLVWPLVVSLAHRWRPAATVLSTDALRVRTWTGGRLRTLPWNDVVAVRPQGRWGDAAHVVPRDGPSVPLPGVTDDVAQALERLVAAANPEVEQPAVTRRPRPTAAPRSGVRSGDGPASGEIEWDGPFRSSR